MKHGLCTLGLVFSVGCAGTPASEMPGKSSVPPAAPNLLPEEVAVAAESSPTSATEQTTAAPVFPVVSHEYRRVYEGATFSLLFEPEPYLVTADGAVNLTTAKLDFEREPARWTVHRGDSLWFGDHFSPMSACPEPSTLLQRVGNKWVPRLEMNVHSLVVQPWMKGSSLAAIVPYRSGPPWGYELTVLERNRTAPQPARRSPEHLPECETRIAWFQTLVAFPSGEIFAFGHECELQPLPERELPPLPDEPGADQDSPENRETLDESVDPEREELLPVLMESWRDGRHEFVEIPLRELGQVIGVGPTDLWAVGTRKDETWTVAYFDGVAWQLLPEHYDRPIVALRVYTGESGPEARRLVLTTRQLLEINNGVTTEHELPPDCAPTDVNLDGEQLWVTCSSDAENVLYTTRTDIAAFRFDAEAPARKLLSFAGKTYPRLDPKGPALRACGSREFQTPGRGPKP